MLNRERIQILKRGRIDFDYHRSKADFLMVNDVIAMFFKMLVKDYYNIKL